MRLLVAAVEDGRIEPIANESYMARMGRAIGPDGRIDADKLAEVADAVAGFVEQAHLLGADDVRAIATSAARDAANGDELVEAVRRTSGVPLEIIDEDEEARLAFFGALSAVEEPWEGEIGVVDVGGGSTEIVVGSVADGITWSRSFRLGSGRLSDAFLEHDPPRPFELGRARRLIEETMPPPDEVPTVAHAAAVGGSASNLRRLVGSLLDQDSLDRAMRLLSERPSRQIARQFGIDPARARILPGGALALEAASRRLGCPLWSIRAGIREGAVLDLLAARSR